MPGLTRSLRLRAPQQYRLGNPLDPNTNLGPMVKASAAETVRKQIADAGTPSPPTSPLPATPGPTTALPHSFRASRSMQQLTRRSPPSRACTVAKGAKPLIDTSLFPADKVRLPALGATTGFRTVA